MTNFDLKLIAFMSLLETEMNADIERRLPTLNESAKKDGRRGYNEIGHDESGKRFIRVWANTGSQKGVRYFVEKETGTIFGAKGWKAYNPNHEYGTLDTITEWDWSDYYAVSKTGKSSLIPKAARR
jgi:hypothetical protein